MRGKPARLIQPGRLMVNGKILPASKLNESDKIFFCRRRNKRGLIVALAAFSCSLILTHAEANTRGYDMIAGGDIYQNTTWAGEVLIKDNVVIKPGATLTVLAGTRVRFKHYRGYREPGKRLRMDVLGAVIARGTPGNPVYFTSDAPDPCNGDWSMIHLKSPQQSIFSYCVFEFAQHGLNVWNGSPVISNCVFRWNNWEGLYFESYCGPVIEYSRIYQNGYNGLAFEQFNTVTMDYCQIWQNGTNGVHADISSLEISRSLVHDNFANGLSVDNGSALRALGVASCDNHGWGIGSGEGLNTVEVSNLMSRGNLHGDIEGHYTVIPSSLHPPGRIDFGFEPDNSYELGYVPGDPCLDRYVYVYPDDETRKIVNKIGGGLGLTWSLAWDGEYIWTATLWGIIYKLVPETGEIAGRFTAPGPQPWGMTYDGEYLWMVDFAEKRLYKLDPATCEELASYPTPDPLGGCKGVAWDGVFLNVMGWTSPVIYRMDRQGNLVDTVNLKQGGGGGIAWDGSYFWVPEGAGRILKYDTEGNCAGWIYSASEGTWDMTWDGEYLWASQRTNENWPDEKIFQLEILNPVVNEDSSCFIASAVYGSPAAREVKTLRTFRDKFLLTNPHGKSFTEIYYKLSPGIAGILKKNSALMLTVKMHLAFLVRAGNLALSI